MRLDFRRILKESEGSNLKAFNALVMKIEQLSAISTPDQQTDRAKIGILMRTIESMPWYVLATVGVESIGHFSGVVQKINHELAKIVIRNPSLEQVDDLDGISKDRAQIKRDILYALGMLDGEASSGDESQDNDTAKTTDSESDGEKVVQYGGQRMYGRNPENYKRHKSNTHNSRGTDVTTTLENMVTMADRFTEGDLTAGR